ncbi:MAG: hypothetical protein P0120_06880 [Nitrospira sp.]|nr:hypothetical protein [Nitrospira sp.]
MIYEYAVEPELLSNWTNFRYFSGQFGVSRGRLISRYPKRWERMVYESLTACPPVEKAKIVERLSRLKDRMITRQNTWDKHKEWLLNAETEHGLRPFRAILAHHNPRSQPFVLEGNDVEENHPLWKVEVSQPVARTPQQICACVGPLLRISKQILFVDPYFRPSQHNYRMLFAELFELFLQDRSFGLASVGIFVSDKISCTGQHFFDECQKYIPALIPVGMQVTIGLWSQRVDGEEIHNRYVLTDRGGVKFGNSLREGDTGTSDDVNLLSDEQHKLRLAQYAGPNHAFDQVSTITIIGTKR